MATVLAVCAASMGTGAQAAVRPGWGSAWAHDGTLKHGCATYSYRYAFTPPKDEEWMAEVFVIGPGHQHVHSEYLVSEADPRRDKRRYRLCDTTADPGRYTIRTRMTVGVASFQTTAWLPRTHFRLAR